MQQPATASISPTLDIENRQDEVLAQLAELERKITSVLAENLSALDKKSVDPRASVAGGTLSTIWAIGAQSP